MGLQSCLSSVCGVTIIIFLDQDLFGNGKEQEMREENGCLFWIVFYFCYFLEIFLKSKKKEDQNQIMTMLFVFLGKKKDDDGSCKVADGTLPSTMVICHLRYSVSWVVGFKPIRY